MNQLFNGVNFCLLLNISLSIMSQLLVSFSQNPQVLQWWTASYTLAICNVIV